MFRAEPARRLAFAGTSTIVRVVQQLNTSPENSPEVDATLAQLHSFGPSRRTVMSDVKLN